MNAHERMRAEVWARVYAGIAASPAGGSAQAIVWADRALKQFDERFPAEEPVAVDWNKLKRKQP